MRVQGRKGVWERELIRGFRSDRGIEGGGERVRESKKECGMGLQTSERQKRGVTGMEEVERVYQN